MAAQWIDGKKISRMVRDEVKSLVEDAARSTGRRPGLAVVLVGDDPASQVYVRSKKKATVEASMYSVEKRLPGTASTEDVMEVLDELNRDPLIHGILVQLPVPPQVDAVRILQILDPMKDVDGLTSANLGRLVQGQPGLRPCTPAGVIELLDRYQVPLAGKRAVVVGRSQLVGLPLALMLLARNASVTVIHSKTAHPDEIAAEADVLAAAVGRPHMIGASWVKPGAAVVDVGINRTDQGLVGDVDFAAVQDKAGHITPVPGGVGPMTVAMLIRNTWLAFQHFESGNFPG